MIIIKLKMSILLIVLLVSITAVSAGDLNDASLIGESGNDEIIVDDLDLLQADSNSDSQSVFETHSDLEKYYGGSERFEVKLYDNLSYDSVVFNINNVNYTRPVVNSISSIAINLAPGVYDITTTCPAAGESVANKITVKSTIEAGDLTKYYKNASKFEAKILDSEGKAVGANQNVVFNINGVFYTRATDENGIARLNINLEQGKYVITTTNPVTRENKSNNVEVLSLIESKDLTKYYKNDSQFTVKIHDATSGDVKFNINGVFYTRPINSNGEATLNINLAPYDYTITTEYNGCMQSNIISVLRTLKTNDLKLFYRDGSKFLAEVLDGQGKKLSGAEVEFNINGVFYHKTTDELGIARLNINLPVGVYIITSSYNGYSAANTVIVSELIGDDILESFGNYSAAEIKRMAYEKLEDINISVGTPSYIGDFKWSVPLSDLNNNSLSPMIIDTLKDTIENALEEYIPDGISDTVVNTIKDAIADSTPDAIRSIIENTIADNIQSALEKTIKDTVHKAVADSIPSSIPSSITNTIENAIADSIQNAIYEKIGNLLTSRV